MKLSHHLRIRLRWCEIAFAVVIAMVTASLRLCSQTLLQTFPAGHFMMDGNSWSTIPFSAGVGTARFQQVYDAAGFQLGIPGPFLIQGMLVREDRLHQNGFSSDFPDFQINLSTTTRAVDGLSSVFSENIGPDNRAVVPRGAFHVGISASTPFGGSDGAAIFFTTPFFYDPSQGNLLLDIFNFGGGSTAWGVPPGFGPAYVDASTVTGDTVSSLFSTDVHSSAGTLSTMGLVTRLWFTPVPEPSTWALMMTAVIAVWFSRNRWRKHPKDA